MHSMDDNDTSSKHWVDVPGWPRAHTYSDQGFRLLVLTDELETGLIGRGPYWLVVCPWCKVTPFAVPRKSVVNGMKGKGVPSCGCRKGFGKNPNCHNGSRKNSG